ncbi:aspartate aminotransferase [Salmonella enterica subsp. enterica]|nr:aspartate aminotransferase [Salmonella enterica subsp. enterica]
MINDIPGVSCVKPRGALYMFPGIDAKRFNIRRPEDGAGLPATTGKGAAGGGTAFNWPWPDHFRHRRYRVTFRPRYYQPL